MLDRIEERISDIETDNNFIKNAIDEIMEILIEVKNRQSATEELLIIRDVIAEEEIDTVVKHIFSEED